MGKVLVVPTESVVPLELVSSGQSVEVVDVAGDPSWTSRIQEMGIRVGACLQVLRSGSPCMLQVGNARFCLRCTAGALILVRSLAGV